MIRAIITDFDGTLVDTFDANFHAYHDAFGSVGLSLTESRYHKCFGYRFDRFMAEMGITDQTTAHQIKEYKKKRYPLYFKLLRPNHALIELIASFKAMGGKTAIASTARKENLMNAVEYLNLADNFNAVFAGMDIEQGKPSPEIYLKAMDNLGVKATDTLIFEDSKVGIEAAKASGAMYMVVSKEQFE